MIELRHPVRTAENTQAAYDALYRQAEITQHWDSFFTWILDLLPLRADKKLLDVSCGTGRSLHLAAARNVQAVGVDFSLVAVQAAQREGIAWVANGEQLPLADQSFDYVLNLGSLEHFEDMESGVQEMARVLKPDGVCCIMVPNTYGLLWTIWHARHTGDVFDDGQPLQRYGTRKQWQRLLEANGLLVQRTLSYEMPPPRTAWQWWSYLRRPKVRMMKYLLWRYVPLNLASMFVFLCGRNPETLR